LRSDPKQYGIVCLHGTLGAGKTTLVRGFARGIGITEPVTSPSYTIVNEYVADKGPVPGTTLYHVDLYRLDSADEFELIGADDILFGRGIAVIEWSEKIASLLPPGIIDVTIEILEGSRRKITVEGAYNVHCGT